MVYHLKFLLVNFICIISMQYDISYLKKIFLYYYHMGDSGSNFVWFFLNKRTYKILVKKLKDKKSIQILKRYKIISFFIF